MIRPFPAQFSRLLSFPRTEEEDKKGSQKQIQISTTAVTFFYVACTVSPYLVLPVSFYGSQLFLFFLFDFSLIKFLLVGLEYNQSATEGRSEGGRGGEAQDCTDGFCDYLWHHAGC